MIMNVAMVRTGGDLSAVSCDSFLPTPCCWVYAVKLVIRSSSIEFQAAAIASSAHVNKLSSGSVTAGYDVPG